MKNATDKLKEKMQNTRNMSLKALAKECVALVVNEGADYRVKGIDYEVTSKYYTGNTLFHYLIKFYSEDASIFEEIEVLLNKYPDSINMLNGRNETPLQTLMNLFSYGSITLENFKKLSLFLANKDADLKVLSTSSSVTPSTLLHFYIKTNVNGINNNEIAALLKKKPKQLVHIKDGKGETALNALLNQRYQLSQQDSNKNMMILVRANSDLSIRDHNQEGNTLLHHLIKTSNKSSNYDEIETLLNHSSDLIHALNGREETPLQYLMNSFTYKNLSLEEFKKLTLLLAKKGANLKELSTSILIPPSNVLYLLMKTGLNGENDETITQLVAIDSNLINLPNEKNDTPVQAILKEKNQISPDFLKKMKKWGADLFCKNSIDATLLHLACHYGNLNVAKYLVSEGLDLFAKINTGQGMLHYCFANHNEALWQWLIDNKLDINAQDTLLQYTPLHYAINALNLDFAKWLIAHHARTDLDDSNGDTALLAAKKTGLDILLFGYDHAFSQNNPEITKNSKSVNKTTSTVLQTNSSAKLSQRTKPVILKRKEQNPEILRDDVTLEAPLQNNPEITRNSKPLDNPTSTRLQTTSSSKLSQREEPQIPERKVQNPGILSDNDSSGSPFQNDTETRNSKPLDNASSTVLQTSLSPELPQRQNSEIPEIEQQNTGMPTNTPRKIIAITLSDPQECMPGRYNDVHIKDNTKEHLALKECEIWERYKDDLNPKDKKEIGANYNKSKAVGSINFTSTSKPQTQTRLKKVGAQVLFGFMTVLGALAVALAFIFLSAAALNPIGLTATVVGGVIAAVGGGLFANSFRKNNKQEIPQPESVASNSI